MIGGASGCGLCPWSSSRKVGAYVYCTRLLIVSYGYGVRRCFGMGRGDDMVSGVARGGVQGARAPPSALGLVNIVHRTASSSTPLAIPNHQLL